MNRRRVRPGDRVVYLDAPWAMAVVGTWPSRAHALARRIPEVGLVAACNDSVELAPERGSYPSTGLCGRCVKVFRDAGFEPVGPITG